MRLRVALLAVGAAVFAGGCDRIPGTVEYEARQALTGMMFDPSAAQVKILAVDEVKRTACGVVNGKNRMGAYVGFTPFIYALGVAEVLPEPPTWSDIRLMKYSDKSDREEKVAEISTACRFGSEWSSACGSLANPGKRPDEELCRLWNANNMHELFDRAERERSY